MHTCFYGWSVSSLHLKYLIILHVCLGYNFTKGDLGTLSYHRIVEAFKFAYAQRLQLGDPDFNDTIKQVGHRYFYKHFNWKNVSLVIISGSSFSLTLQHQLKVILISPLQVVEFMLNPGTAESMFSRINDSTTHEPDYYMEPVLTRRTAHDHGTSHLSVLAENGDAVALTSTINNL